MYNDLNINSNTSLGDYRYGFNGMESDNEVKGEGNSYDFGARIYDSRVGRWLSGDPLESKYPFVSTYSYCLNNPVVLIDPNGEEPIKPRVGSRSDLIAELRKAGVDDFKSLMSWFGGGKYVKPDPNNENQNTIRYIYSESWGWLDMRHFAAAANYTEGMAATGHMVLDRGEGKEVDQSKSNDPTEKASAWGYEDLPSNLVGVYFETFLDSDMATGDDFLENLELYLEYLDVVENPLEAAPNEVFDDYLEYDDLRKRGVPQNYTYEPIEEHTTKERSGWVDEQIEEYLQEYIDGATTNRKEAQEK